MPSKTRGNLRAIAKTPVKARARTQARTKPRAAKAGSATKAGAARGAGAKRSTRKPAVSRSTRAAAPRQKKVRKQPDGLAFRLESGVKPLAYRLHLRVDPARRSDYSGVVEIDLQLDGPRTTIELHAAELSVPSASVAFGDAQHALEVAYKPERETIALSSQAALPKGPLTLHIAFSATLRTDLRGFYAAKSDERSYAITQLEAADARRFFPCFDEPACKARFTISVTTALENTVISNNPVEREELHEGDDKTVHFSQTPLLSSYLVAVAVGEFAVSEPVMADGVPIRIVHVPGSEAMTAFALDTARECLTRLAEYFALPYPYEKLDLVAMPDFEIGAMENAGAVFFRETLLLVEEASVSLPEKKRAAEVICHELAHMWYGNLVTMRWWDDLWLNEAFATWMAFDIVAKWRPEWKMWNDFGHSRDSALQLDALDNTHAIYTEVGTPSEATQNFDLITYEKGAAVVRMLERYLGPKVFQRGVRRYIKRHRESNTVASDLWNALSEAAGRDIDALVKPFVEQPGFPLVRIEQTNAAGKLALRLQQERFSAQGPSAKPSKRAAVGGKPLGWQVPWVGRVGAGRKSAVVRHLLETTRTVVPLSGTGTGKFPRVDYVYGNADEGGFFRPLHHPRDLPGLVRALPQLEPSERLGFVQHQWALVRAGYAELDTFLPLLAALGSERDPDVLRALVGPADFLVDDLARFAGRDARNQLQALIASTFGPALAELAWGSADSNEPNDVRLRRAELLTLVAVVAEAEGIAREAEVRCIDYLNEQRPLDANVIGPVLIVGARYADAQRLETLLAASERDPTPQARRRFRLVIADVRDPALVESVLLACLSPRIPTQDVAFVLARLLRNPHARAQAFDFIRAHWAELRERVPSMLMSRLIDATPALAGEQQRRAVMSFFAAHPVPTATRALRQADERFRLDARFRTHAGPALRRWLASQAVG